MNFLLDTCVISELTSKQANPKVVAWIDSLRDENVFISVITIGEIQRGIELLTQSRKRTQLEEWLNNGILVRFQRNIIPIDTRVIMAWGAMVAHLDKTGAPMPALDSLIAASASYHNLILATRNLVDFKNAQVQVFSPWS